MNVFTSQSLMIRFVVFSLSLACIAAQLPGTLGIHHMVRQSRNFLGYMSGVADTLLDRSCSSYLPGVCDAKLPMDHFLVANNTCFLGLAYYPKEELEKILPTGLTIPNDRAMSSFYPDTELKDGYHPFMLGMCHCAKMHDVITRVIVPEQEEIMILIPVNYTNPKTGRSHLVSFCPVLYLDSIVGVLGGNLLFALRKQYHWPFMKFGRNDTNTWWDLKGHFKASFEVKPSKKTQNPELPQFFAQTYGNPLATLSYPMPFTKLMFFHYDVFPHRLENARGKLNWQYKGVNVTHDNPWVVYSEYTFGLSLPVSYL